MTPEAQSWSQLVGNAPLKRALEVALARDHTLTVIGHPDNGWDLLRTLFHAHDPLTFLNLETVAPCPCGNYQDTIRECTCAIDRLVRYRHSARFRRALCRDIIIPCVTPTSREYRVTDEPWAAVNARIHHASTRTVPEDLRTTGWELLRLAISKLGLTMGAVSRIQKVARTIALLDVTATAIESVHVSEAIQYQAYSI